MHSYLNKSFIVEIFSLRVLQMHVGYLNTIGIVSSDRVPGCIETALNFSLILGPVIAQFWRM